MAPKNRQSVKKKSPSSCPTCFISVTQPYISNLREGRNVLVNDGDFTAGTADRMARLPPHMNSAKAQGGIFSPDNKTGNDCPQESISQD